jgi:hypothetical protein
MEGPPVLREGSMTISESNSESSGLGDRQGDGLQEPKLKEDILRKQKEVKTQKRG